MKEIKMKYIFQLMLLFNLCYFNSYSQHITIKRIESRLITNEGIEFLGNLNDKSNDLYSFSNWRNEGIIYLNNKAYSLSNINFNVNKNLFESRISRDKLFAFNKAEIDSVRINNFLFKKIGNSYYEVLFESENNLLLKKHDITFRKGIENRLGGGTLGKTKELIAYNYLIKSGDLFKRVELKKNSILEVLNPNINKKFLANFVKKEDLSYKKVKDIIRIFKFILRNSNSII
ncbi:MAG: hypothetical protein QM495_03560 [Lutibacter sp.]|uniref:hypothetical protein n=1 Tax=Lutibacter sp. TaxID=1925666 RepID=UPI00385E96E7